MAGGTKALSALQAMSIATGEPSSSDYSELVRTEMMIFRIYLHNSHLHRMQCALAGTQGKFLKFLSLLVITVIIIILQF